MTRARPSERAAGIRVASTGSAMKSMLSGCRARAWVQIGTRGNRSVIKKCGARMPMRSASSDRIRAGPAAPEQSSNTSRVPAVERKSSITGTSGRRKPPQSSERLSASMIVSRRLAGTQSRSLNSKRRALGRSDIRFRLRSEAGPIRRCVRPRGVACGALPLGRRPGARLRFG